MTMTRISKAPSQGRQPDEQLDLYGRDRARRVSDIPPGPVPNSPD